MKIQQKPLPSTGQAQPPAARDESKKFNSDGFQVFKDNDDDFSADGDRDGDHDDDAGKAKPKPVDVEYHGGGVLKHPSVQNVYVGDYYKTAAGQGDAKYNDAFMANMMSDPGYASIWRQYGVDSAGPTAPSTRVPGKFDKITQDQLTQMALAAAKADPSPSPERIYNFVLPPDAELVAETGVSSHDKLPGLTSNARLPDGRNVFFTATVYGQGSNGMKLTDVPRDNISAVESRLVSNEVTNPFREDAALANDWSKAGWADADNGQIASVPWNRSEDVDPKTVLTKVNGYTVQKLWSQDDQAMETAAKNPGGVERLPKPVDMYNMKYFGGGILKNPEVKNVYVGDYFNSAQGQSDRKHNDAFMADLVSNPISTSLWHQYGVDSGMVDASTAIPGSYPKVTEAQLIKMTTNLAMKDQSTNKELIYNFVLPPDAELVEADGDSSKKGLGGFHSTVKLKDGREVVYSVAVYATKGNGADLTNAGSLNNVSAIESHEIIEAATDPYVRDVNQGEDNKLGWYADKRGELADLTINNAPPGTPPQAMTELMDGFMVQKLWSIKDNRPEIGALHPGPVEALPRPSKS